jgi:hypothetical protein
VLSEETRQESIAADGLETECLPAQPEKDCAPLDSQEMREDFGAVPGVPENNSKRRTRTWQKRRRLFLTINLLLLAAAALLALSPFLLVASSKHNQARLQQMFREINKERPSFRIWQTIQSRPGAGKKMTEAYRRAFAALWLSEDDYLLLSQAAAGRTDLENPAFIASAKGILTDNAEALDLIRQASTKRQVNLPLEWNAEIGFTSSALDELHTCSKLLALESIVLAREKRFDEALEACETNLRLSAAAGQDFLMGEMMRYSMIKIASQSLAEVLYDSQPSAEACHLLAEEISKIDLVPGFQKAVRGERISGIQSYNTLALSGNPLEEARKWGGASFDAGVPEVILGHPVFMRWWVTSEQAAYVEWMGDYVARCELPYRKAITVRPSPEEYIASLPWWRPPLLMELVMPRYAEAFKLRDQAIANLSLAEIALLLKSYKAESGSYPSSLEELREFAGRELPKDPFSGDVFVYHPDGAGFLLYSWGPNLQDNAGTPAFSPHADDGDLVFRCAR